jgi:hypothetical protein
MTVFIPCVGFAATIAGRVTEKRSGKRGALA